MVIDVVNACHDALLELVLGAYPSVAQDGAGELGEAALDQVELGAVFGREGKFEAACRSFIELGFGLFRDMC
ncbi:hypothetical protein [Brucella pituitosa]|uniref:hypothetical protein n=1 Tax=Brucella pituitosa TaxID=571256 RepID=UPI003F4AD81A